MIAADRLLAAPPAEFLAISAGPRRTPLDRSAQAIGAALRFGGQAERYEAAVLVGAPRCADLAELHALAPGIQFFLILEPDLKAARSFYDELAAGCQGLPSLEQIFLSAGLTEVGGYSVDAYGELSRFLRTGIRFDHTLILIDPARRAEQPDLVNPVIQAVEDLIWGQSTRLLAMSNEPQDFDISFCQTWGDYLAMQGQVIHGLKFLELLAGRVPMQTLAQKVSALWIQAGAFAPLWTWIPGVVETEAGRAELRAEVAQAQRKSQELAAQCRERNLAALRQHHPALYPVVADHVVSPNRWVAYASSVPWVLRSGEAPHIEAAPWVTLCSREGAFIREHNPRTNPARLWEALGEPRDLRSISAAVVGAAHCIDALENAIHLKPDLSLYANAEQAIYVVERDLDLFQLLIESVDLSAFLAERRIHWFLGDKAEAELGIYLRARPMLPIPNVRVAASTALSELLDQVEEERRAKTLAMVSTYPEIYGASHSDEFDRILAGQGDRPLRAFFWTSLFTTVIQYCTRDLAAACQRLGMETMIFKERHSTERGSGQAFTEAITSFRPDIIFFIDHLRPENGGLLPKEVPLVSWIQDELRPLFDPQLVAQLGPNDYTYALYSEWVERGRQLGYPHIEYLPNAANIDLYHPIAGIKPVDEVAFISNFDERPIFHPHFAPVLDWMETALEERGIGFQRASYYASLLREALSATGISTSSEIFDRLLFFVRQDFERWFHRRQTVRWVIEAGFPVALYGAGWGEDPAFAPYARGRVASGEELARVYQQSKVVLHVNNHYNCHQRVFECIASGGLVVARGCPSDHTPGELADRLVIGSEVQVFSTRDELAALIGRAFADDAWRSSCIEAGRTRVIAEHTYVNRIEEILSDIRATRAATRHIRLVAGGGQ